MGGVCGGLTAFPSAVSAFSLWTIALERLQFPFNLLVQVTWLWKAGEALCGLAAVPLGTHSAVGSGLWCIIEESNCILRRYKSIMQVCAVPWAEVRACELSFAAGKRVVVFSWS